MFSPANISGFGNDKDVGFAQSLNKYCSLSFLIVLLGEVLLGFAGGGDRCAFTFELYKYYIVIIPTTNHQRRFGRVVKACAC